MRSKRSVASGTCNRKEVCTHMEQWGSVQAQLVGSTNLKCPYKTK